MSKHRNNSSLYFAYGANLNLNTMSKRCSTATPLRTVSLFGWKLIFRGVADIIPSPGDVVHGGLYRVHPNDEAALDRFEGVDIGLYTRIDLDDGTDEFFAYKMNGTDEMAPPYASYLNVIRQGYLDWNLPDDQLKNALKPFTNVKS